MTAVVDQVKNEGRVVRFSVNPPSSQDCAEATHGWNLINLVPGLLVKATIKKVESLFSCNGHHLLNHSPYNVICVYFAGDKARIDPELPVLIHWPGGFPAHGARAGFRL